MPKQNVRRQRKNKTKRAPAGPPAVVRLLAPPIKRRSRVPYGSQRSTKYSECALQYARCVEDPKNSDPVCVPATINMSSLKVKRSIKGVFYTGTAGYGYIAMSPGRSLGTTGQAVISTQDTYAGTSTSFMNVFDTGVLGQYFPTDYSSSASDQNVMVRVVAAGLYIQNRTPIMSRGAITYGLETPAHSTLVGNSNNDVNVPLLSSITADDSSYEISTDKGDWVSVVWHPAGPEDVNFVPMDQIAMNNTLGRSSGNYTLGFVVNSLSAVKQTFCFEAYVCYEVVGAQPGGETLSPSDPTGFAMANTLFQHQSIRQPRAGDRWGKFISLAKFVATNLPEVLSFVRKLST